VAHTASLGLKTELRVFTTWHILLSSELRTVQQCGTNRLPGPRDGPNGVNDVEQLVGVSRLTLMSLMSEGGPLGRLDVSLRQNCSTLLTPTGVKERE